MSRRIVVHLVQDKLFGLFRIEYFRSFSATCEPKLLAMLFHGPWSGKEEVSKLYQGREFGLAS